MAELMATPAFSPVFYVASVLALLIAIIGHEIMHGFVALKFGDSTAQSAGRLSLNPLVHLDLVGSLLIPVLLFLANAPFLFGWAKPVPVRIDRVIQKGGYFGAFAVSAAGILYNFLLAILATLLFFLIGKLAFSLDFTDAFLFFLVHFCVQLIFYNVLLGLFNCIPIPPLDGSNILAYLGLMGKTDFFAKLFNKIPPILGMAVVLIFLSTPLSRYLFELVLFIVEFLTSLFPITAQEVA